MADKRKIYLIDSKFRIKFSALPGLLNLPLVRPKGASGKPLSGNDKGFSLMSVLTAAGLMGGLALVMAQLTKQQHEMQKKGETGVEVVALSNRIVRTLYDGDACKNTLSTRPNNQPSVVPIINMATKTLGSVRDKNDNKVYETGKIYGNGLLKVDSLKLLSPSISGNQATAKFEIVLHKQSRGVTGYKKVKKEFDLTLELDTANSNRLLGCVSDLSSEGNALKKEVCTEIGGTWMTATQTCTSPLANKSCSSGKYLVGFDGSGDVVCTAMSSTGSGGNCRFMKQCLSLTMTLTLIPTNARCGVSSDCAAGETHKNRVAGVTAIPRDNAAHVSNPKVNAFVDSLCCK